MRAVLLMLLACVAVALPRPAAAQETAGLREWWAACDARRTCWAFGFTDAGADPLGFVRIERGGAAGAEPVVVLATGLWEGEEQRPTATMRVSVDGAPGPVLTARAGEDHAFYVGRVEDPRAARALIAALRRGGRLTLQLDGWTAPAVVSLDGATAALLWLDDRQKRAGGVTALARPGPKPASAVPPPPSRRIVRAARAAPQDGLPEGWPPAVAARPEVRSCLDEMTSDELKTPDVARLDAETLLWGVPCSQGAYQVSYLFFLADAEGRGWRPAPFEPPPEGDGEGMWVTTPSYDAETRTLSAWAKGRGLGDCGTASAWTWTGARFVLTHEQTMGECRGVPPEFWPVTVDADVRR